MSDENRQAYDLYQKIQAIGAETVFALLDLRMHTVDAENLLERIVMIGNMIADLQERHRKED